MPGIAARTASQILLAIDGDISRFKDAAHLAAYAGIAPVTRQSGTSIHGERPARGGNKRLKNVLFQTAFVAIRLDPESRAYYDRKRVKGTPQRGGHMPGTQTMQRHLQHATQRHALPTRRNPHHHEPKHPRTRPQTTTRHNTPRHQTHLTNYTGTHYVVGMLCLNPKNLRD